MKGAFNYSLLHGAGCCFYVHKFEQFVGWADLYLYGTVPKQQAPTFRIYNSFQGFLGKMRSQKLSIFTEEIKMATYISYLLLS